MDVEDVRTKVHACSRTPGPPKMEHRAAELERQVLRVSAAAGPGRRRHRDMDREQALSRLVPVGSVDSWQPTSTDGNG